MRATSSAVTYPLVCEGGRGVWYLPADTAASPGPSGANCGAWVVVPCAARSERRDGRGVSRWGGFLVSMVEWLPCCVWVEWCQAVGWMGLMAVPALLYGGVSEEA